MTVDELMNILSELEPDGIIEVQTGGLHKMHDIPVVEECPIHSGAEHRNYHIRGENE